MSEQVENLRKAEASLQEAEKRLALVRKWQPRLQHAVLEYHASVQRIKDLAATDVPNAALLLGRIVDAIEAYLRVQPPSGRRPERGARRRGGPSPADGVDRDDGDRGGRRPRSEARPPGRARTPAPSAAEPDLDRDHVLDAAASTRPRPER